MKIIFLIRNYIRLAIVIEKIQSCFENDDKVCNQIDGWIDWIALERT